jgi:RNA polymerase sigma-70 factor (ECF subfamily)
MAQRIVLAEQFDRLRPKLHAVAYSMLGSVSEAEDAVQECWLRLDRSDPDAINDLQGWLTTVVGRICLDMLKARKARRERYLGSWLPEPVVEDVSHGGPEQQTVLADSIGLALLVVLESLTPPERLAFVLHDVFAVPFDEIARIMDRTAESARQLASRARRRVQAAPQPDPDLALQRRVVDAFLAAARSGDFQALLDVLDPDFVFRADPGPPAPRRPVIGADAVARRVLQTAPRFISGARVVIVNGAVGALFGSRDDRIAVLGFTVVNGRIAALDLIADPAKLSGLTIEP